MSARYVYSVEAADAYQCPLLHETREQALEAAKKEADEALDPSTTTEIYTARVVPSVDLLMLIASRIGWRCGQYVAAAAEDESVLEQVIAPLTREQERALGRHIINWYRVHPGTLPATGTSELVRHTHTTPSGAKT